MENEIKGKNNVKKVIGISIFVIALVLTIGISYAMYSKTINGTNNNKLVAGVKILSGSGLPNDPYVVGL